MYINLLHLKSEASLFRGIVHSKNRVCFHDILLASSVFDAEIPPYLRLFKFISISLYFI